MKNLDGIRHNASTVFPERIFLQIAVERRIFVAL